MSTKAPPQQASATTLQQRLVTLCKHPQFVWFLGHVLLLACSLRYLLSLVTFSAAHHTLAYRSAFVGSLVTYGIVLFKTYGDARTRGNGGKIDVQLAARVWADENTQYFALALYWLLTRPVAVALVPYVCFSAFHFLTYVRTNVLPTVDPSAAQQDGKTTAANVSRTIKGWVSANYEKAMRLVAGIEVVLLGGRVLLGVLTFGYIFPSTPVTTLLVLAAFLRYRYFTSAFTRQQFSQLALQVDHALADQRVPPALRQGWSTVKGLMSNYAGRQPGAATTSARKAQ